MNELLEHVKAAGFPYWKNVIHLFVGGSALHGAKVEGYDDLDIYGAYVEPPEKILVRESFIDIVKEIFPDGNFSVVEVADNE